MKDYEKNQKLQEAYEQGYMDCVDDTEEWYPKTHKDHIEIAENIHIFPIDQITHYKDYLGKTISHQHENGWFIVWIGDPTKNKILNQLAKMEKTK